MKYIVFSLVVLGAVSCVSQPAKFGVTKEFINIYFQDNMAERGDKFNKTDIVKTGLPMVRLVDEFVTNNMAFIWYEQGGFVYSQHLVQYNVLNPSEIISCHSFGETKHKNIYELLSDKEFIKESKNESCKI